MNDLLYIVFSFILLAASFFTVYVATAEKIMEATPPPPANMPSGVTAYLLSDENGMKAAAVDDGGIWYEYGGTSSIVLSSFETMAPEGDVSNFVSITYNTVDYANWMITALNTSPYISTIDKDFFMNLEVGEDTYLFISFPGNNDFVANFGYTKNGVVVDTLTGNVIAIYLHEREAAYHVSILFSDGLTKTYPIGTQRPDSISINGSISSMIRTDVSWDIAELYNKAFKPFAYQVALSPLVNKVDQYSTVEGRTVTFGFIPALMSLTVYRPAGFVSNGKSIVVDADVGHYTVEVLVRRNYLFPPQLLAIKLQVVSEIPYVSYPPIKGYYGYGFQIHPYEYVNIANMTGAGITIEEGVISGTLSTGSSISIQATGTNGDTLELEIPMDMSDTVPSHSDKTVSISYEESIVSYGSIEVIPDKELTEGTNYFEVGLGLTIDANGVVGGELDSAPGLMNDTAVVYNGSVMQVFPLRIGTYTNVSGHLSFEVGNNSAMDLKGKPQLAVGPAFFHNLPIGVTVEGLTVNAYPLEPSKTQKATSGNPYVRGSFTYDVAGGPTSGRSGFLVTGIVFLALAVIMTVFILLR